jgi:hypothetical protein
MNLIERGLITFVTASVGLALAISVASGASNGSRILATAYEPIVPGTALALKTADNSDLTMQAQELMDAELRRLGYHISDDSPLVLTIGTSAPAAGNDRLDLPMRVAGGTSAVALRFKLIGTNSSGLLQEKADPAAEDYQITLSIRDRRTDRYLWRGLANICQCGEGILTATRHMAPELAGAIGRTMGPQPVAFDAIK